MNATRIRTVLEQYGITPSKALGQNFLTDENIARFIVEQLEPTPQDCIIEVGPGAGSLTEIVAPLCRKLILVEFDKRLADYQRTRWAEDSHVEVHQADAATWDPRPLFAEQPVKFLGNLPYSSGGAILANFLHHESPCSRAVIMLQKELVERILAKPGDEAYGLLTLRMQMNWEGSMVRTVPPTPLTTPWSPRPGCSSPCWRTTCGPTEAWSSPPSSAPTWAEKRRWKRLGRYKKLPSAFKHTPGRHDLTKGAGISGNQKADRNRLRSGP